VTTTVPERQFVPDPVMSLLMFSEMKLVAAIADEKKSNDQTKRNT
jgi:hypothetical protein